jgi:hypothetical protein
VGWYGAVASNHAFVSSVVKRTTSVAQAGCTASKIAGIAAGMTISMGAFPLSKSNAGGASAAAGAADNASATPSATPGTGFSTLSNSLVKKAMSRVPSVAGLRGLLGGFKANVLS